MRRRAPLGSQLMDEAGLGGMCSLARGRRAWCATLRVFSNGVSKRLVFVEPRHSGWVVQLFYSLP